MYSFLVKFECDLYYESAILLKVIEHKLRKLKLKTIKKTGIRKKNAT